MRSKTANRRGYPVPLYEYRCTVCGHVFEKIQSFSAPDEKECPKCGGAVERLLSAPAIQFKGSGFYLTDYGKRSDGKSEGGSSKGGSSEGGSSGSSFGSDSGSSSGASDSSASSATPKSNTGSSGSTGSSGGSSSGGSGSTSSSGNKTS
jgi:putative FmdB family regulatory protein